MSKRTYDVRARESIEDIRDARRLLNRHEIYANRLGLSSNALYSLLAIAFPEQARDIGDIPMPSPEMVGLHVGEITRFVDVFDAQTSRTIKELSGKRFISCSLGRRDKRKIEVGASEEGKQVCRNYLDNFSRESDK